MSDWYLAQFARQDQYGDTPPANWPVPQMPEQPEERDPFEAAALRVRAPYRNTAAVGSNRIGQLAEQVTSMPSWADVATQQMNKDKEAFQTGGIGSLLADTSVAQELAGGFGGTTKAVGKPPVLGELASPFYSAAGRAVENAKLGKGTGEQWLGYLRNQPGVKPEELQYVFGNLPEGQLTKAQMQAHAAENAVTLGEVVKGNPLEKELMTPDSPGFDPDRIQRANPTKYSQWQLPGGENYRETLLTLPERKPPAGEMPMGFTLTNETEAARAAGFNVPADAVERWTYRGPGIGSRVFNNRADAVADAQRYSSEGKNPLAFHSSHWDEPNVLAHVRTNDREIPGVGKSLHVEEIQSDWHQKGRTQGYVGGPVENRLKVPVPDAPFKSTWADVALKRQIREAAEKGYDAISWTPGKAQAARYPDALRQAVSNISWSSPGAGGRANPDGLRYVHAQPNGGGTDLVFTINKDGAITEASSAAAKGKHVEDIFGKDMAKQIMGEAEGDIASKDFVIGAKGMEGFYDKMLVDKANAIGKKHGARVEQAEIDTKPERGPVPEGSHDFSRTAPVHVLRITPELRAAAMKGFPLFTAGGVVAGGTIGELARQDKYGRNE